MSEDQSDIDLLNQILDALSSLQKQVISLSDRPSVPKELSGAIEKLNKASQSDVLAEIRNLAVHTKSAFKSVDELRAEAQKMVTSSQANVTALKEGYSASVDETNKTLKLFYKLIVSGFAWMAISFFIILILVTGPWEFTRNSVCKAWGGTPVAADQNFRGGCAYQRKEQNDRQASYLCLGGVLAAFLAVHGVGPRHSGD